MDDEELEFWIQEYQEMIHHHQASLQRFQRRLNELIRERA